MAAVDVADEFETIRSLLAPLAHPEWGRGLIDDVAVLPSRPGYDLVLTKDAIVEGVHFLAEDPLDTVARKLLRVNLSDLAAKGAEPFGYLLACHWSTRCGWPERETFVAGLAADQAEFGIHLLGGDTVVTPGPLSFSATMLGWVPKGLAVSRVGAKPGHMVFVTGTIGDGALGLSAARDDLPLEAERVEALAARYRTPMPRTAFAAAIRDLASSAIDVSDGLVADLGHIAEASGVGIEIDILLLPRSIAAQAWLEGRVDEQVALEKLATGGDDYEIAFTMHPANEAALRQRAADQHLRLTCLGHVTTGEGMVVRYAGLTLDLTTKGWVHR